MSEPITDDQPSSPIAATTPVVAAAVLFVDMASLPVSVESIRRQAYGSGSVTVIGGGREAAEWCAAREVGHLDSFEEFVTGLDTVPDYVWILHGDARPRPDALGALVQESERNEAAVAGSKVLDAAQPDRLESVGASTDVFGEPYGGLDLNEVDLEQYDVVRDVAFVAGVSTLIRRDLLRGLGSIDPILPPVSAGLDLSQRARVAGGRVMVVPSSEVLHARYCREDVEGWREQAGRMRAMAKVYRPITLLWAIPFGWVVWLVDALVRLCSGNVRPLLDLFAATGWNLARMPSTLALRGPVNRIRVTGDEELFRYQVSGSVRMRQLGTDLGSRFGWIIDQEPGVVTEEEMEKEGSAATAVIGVVVALLVALATRALWLGAAPAVGYWLPLGDDPASVLGPYAGGWNPAGLGSGESLHPSVAAVAAVQWLLGGWGGASALVALASLVAGVLGIPRLLSRMGVTGAGRYVGSAVYVAGPFVGLMGDAGYWPGYLALGWIPWLVDAVMAPPTHGRALWGRIGRIVLAAGLLGTFAPVALLVPLVAVICAIPLVGTSAVRPAALWWALVAAVAGADVIAAYLLGVPPSGLVGRVVDMELWPADVWLIGVLAAAVLSLVFAPAPAATAGWGGTMAAAALLLDIVGNPGGEVEVAALLLLGSLGSAVAVGAAARVDLDMGPVAISGQTLAAAAALLVAASVVPAVPNGRAGLPDDRWGRALEFATQLEGEAGGERILMVGTEGSLVGDHRFGNGYAYRLLRVPGPTLDQAWLSNERIGDRALKAVMEEIERASSPRPGALLAQFAVRWVVTEDDSPIVAALDAQVDLAERNIQPGLIVYENLAFTPRVTGVEGWRSERVGAEGPPGDGRVRIADNADPGWRPDWTQSEWANEVSAADGTVGYRTDPLRLWLAVASLPILLAAAALAFRGRERR